MNAVVAFLCSHDARKHKFWLPSACRAYVECSDKALDTVIETVVEEFPEVKDIIGIGAYMPKPPHPSEVMAALAAVALAQMIIDDRFTIQNNRVTHKIQYCHGCYLLFTGQGGQNMMQHEDGCLTPLPPLARPNSPSPSCSPQDCSGCKELQLGTGGENQLSHSCIR